MSTKTEAKIYACYIRRDTTRLGRQHGEADVFFATNQMEHSGAWVSACIGGQMGKEGGR